jgi:hypothetical protein
MTIIPLEKIVESNGVVTLKNLETLQEYIVSF